MSIAVDATDRFHFVGDSITAEYAWYPALGTAMDDVWASGGPKRRPSRATGAVGYATGGGSVQVPVANYKTMPAVTASGISGSVIANIATDVAGRITSYNPTVVVIHIGINDAYNGQTASQFQAFMEQIFAAIVAWNAATKIFFSSCFCRGEQWAAGPAWGPNPYDVRIAEYLAIGPAVCAAYGVQWIDWRTPLLADEAAHNAGPPGAASGYATVDGLHPNATGKALMAAACLAGGMSVT